MLLTSDICLASLARLVAEEKLGTVNNAKIEMMAMTTISSIRVNACFVIISVILAYLLVVVNGGFFWKVILLPYPEAGNRKIA